MTGMEIKYIEDGWNSYRKLVVPNDASPVQLRETRQAFYAGASLLFSALMITLDEGQEPTDDDMARMASIQAEIDAFGQEIDKRIFGQKEH